MKKTCYLLLAAGLLCCNRPPVVKRVLRQSQSAEGTSVVFVSGKDTMGFDFLSPHEYDSIFPTCHRCKWELCPYKGVPMADRLEAIIEYTGCDEGTDGYCADWLHFEYPTYEYDQLDSLMFTPKK